MLTRQRVVFTRSPGSLVYRLNDPDLIDDRQVILGEDDFEDMGRPDIITVTIEPGDELNEPTRHTWEVEVT